MFPNLESITESGVGKQTAAAAEHFHAGRERTTHVLAGVAWLHSWKGDADAEAKSCTVNTLVLLRSGVHNAKRSLTKHKEHKEIPLKHN